MRGAAAAVGAADVEAVELAGGVDAAAAGAVAARPGVLAAGARLKLIHVRRPRIGMAGV